MSPNDVFSFRNPEHVRWLVTDLDKKLCHWQQHKTEHAESEQWQKGSVIYLRKASAIDNILASLQRAKDATATFLTNPTQDNLSDAHEANRRWLYYFRFYQSLTDE